MFGGSIKYSIFASTFVVCAVVMANENRENWVMHHKIVESFPCRHPQPRSFSLKDLNITNIDRKVSPVATVLHRCESAGCCKEGKTCLPSNFKEVSITFSKNNILDEYFVFKAINHTQCSCQKDRNQPK